ncbi:Transcription factor TFIID [anaerobic digester metagenome]
MIKGAEGRTFRGPDDPSHLSTKNIISVHYCLYSSWITQLEAIIISNYSIQNVVASANLGIELDLTELALNLNGAEYEPETFPGLIFRLKEPKTATLLFRSGKLVCTGATNLEQVNKAVKTVVANIRKAGVKVDAVPPVQVQNIVASADLGQPVNLSSVVITLGLDRVEYEPEVFPGLVYRLTEPKVVILLFGSGKLVCTGAKVPEDVEAAVNNIKNELRAENLLL